MRQRVLFNVRTRFFVAHVIAAADDRRWEPLQFLDDVPGTCTYTCTVSLPYSNTQSPNTNYIYQLLTEHPHPVTTQPLNFLRTLRQVREAAALGLIEGKDVELDTRLDQSYARRIQAFQRFILEQLHKEEMLGVNNVGGRGGKNTHSNGENKPNENDNDINGGVESLFALTSTQTHSCAQCKHAEVRTARSFQTDLAVSFILPYFRIGNWTDVVTIIFAYSTPTRRTKTRFERSLPSPIAFAIR